MSMTKEQEAIERVSKILELETTPFNNSKSVLITKTDLETVLNMLKVKDEEIEKLKADNKKAWKLNANISQRHLSDIFKIKKKDRQIDLMAEQLAGLAIWNNEKEEALILSDKEEVKNYYERKSEE